MSRFSENRLADNIVRKMEDPIRRRRDAAVVVITFAAGLLANFYFNKAEIAALCWFVTLCGIADFVLSFGKPANMPAAWRVILVVLFAISGVALSSPLLYEQYSAQHAALLSGVLRAVGTPRGGAPGLQFGDQGVTLGWTGPNGGSMIKSFADKLIIERGEGGTLQVTTTVRDRSGNLIVEIIKNHWRVSDLKTSCWDKNYGDDLLEVKDGRGRVVLQLRLLPDVVQLQVEWADHNNKITEVGRYTEDDGITPVFKYPSTEHWRELDPKSGYEYAGSGR